MSIREHDEYSALADKLQREEEDKEFERNSWKMDGPATVFVPAGYRAIVYIEKKGM